MGTESLRNQNLIDLSWYTHRACAWPPARIAPADYLAYCPQLMLIMIKTLYDDGNS